MKKILVMMMVILIAVTAVFAADPPEAGDHTYDSNSDPAYVTPTRTESKKVVGASSLTFKYAVTGSFEPAYDYVVKMGAATLSSSDNTYVVSTVGADDSDGQIRAGSLTIDIIDKSYSNAYASGANTNSRALTDANSTTIKFTRPAAWVGARSEGFQSYALFNAFSLNPTSEVSAEKVSVSNETPTGETGVPNELVLKIGYVNGLQDLRDNTSKVASVTLGWAQSEVIVDTYTATMNIEYIAQ